MANFGIQATNLSGPDASGAKFIKSPVKDDSGLILGQTLGELGADAYVGYQKASLEQAQEKVINDYIDSKKNPQRMADAEFQIGALDKAEESLFNRAASDPNYQPDVNDFSGIEKTLAEQLNKYKAAKDQGVMSPQEFSDRILATTRAAVAQNPGLYDELTQHASRMLELSGIQSVIKADLKQQEEVSKAQSKMEDYYLSLGKQFDVPIPRFSNGATDWSTFVSQIETLQKQKQLVNIAENFGKLDTEDRKNQARAWLGSNGIPLMNGALNDVLSSAIANFNAGGDVTGVLTKFRLDLNQVQQKYTEKLLPISNDPNAKAALDYLDKQKQVLENLFAGVATKEDAIKLSNNLNTLLQNDQYKEASTYANPKVVSLVASVLSAAGPQATARILGQDPKLLGNITKTLSNIYSGAAGSLGTDYTLKMGKDNAVSTGIAHLAQQAVQDKEAVPILEKALSAIRQDINNPEKFPDTASKFNFYEKLIHDLGTPEVKMGVSKVGAKGYQEAATMIDDYMNLVIPSMMTSILKWEKQGIPVQLDVLPDGRAIFRSPDANAARDLNSRYTPRINDSLQAMANLMGTDTKSAAVNTFYPTYLPAWNDNPNLQATEIRTKNEADRALEAGKISKAEHTAILKEMPKEQNTTDREKEISDAKKEIHTSEAALKTAIKRGETDKSYLEYLRKRIEDAKKVIGE